jgi:hypothetical protein
METRIFSIFSVADYKGGDLKAYTNLNTSSFLRELYENLVECNSSLNLYLNSDMSSKKEILAMLLKHNNSDTLFIRYAGGDHGFCGKVYEHINGKLVELSFRQLMEFLAEYIEVNLEDVIMDIS